MNAELPELADLWQTTLGWSPSSQQQQQFQRLLTQVLELNQTVNLTRITDSEAFWEKHLWDSLWGIKDWLVPEPKFPPLEPSLNVIDIGTGGGFPGCPAAIACPNWQITLLDSTRKKIACLETLCQTLPLKNATAICDRAETLGQNPNYREHYDRVLIRAVGPASTCAEYALPFLKVGGTAVLYRGQWSLAEEQILARALRHLDADLVETQVSNTPLTQAQRHCLYLQKSRITNVSYPRQNGLPSKYPLGLTDLASVSGSK
jgi:16S rRNA (guanine527-N7)-methyltransferase